MVIGHIRAPALLFQCKILMNLIGTYILFFPRLQGTKSVLSAKIWDQSPRHPAHFLFSTPSAHVRLTIIKLHWLSPEMKEWGNRFSIPGKCRTLQFFRDSSPFLWHTLPPTKHVGDRLFASKAAGICSSILVLRITLHGPHFHLPINLA